MYKITLSLGTCAVYATKPMPSCWTVLSHYGISRHDLKNLNLSYDELYEVYQNVQKHEEIRNFLISLKEKIKLTRDHCAK